MYSQVNDNRSGVHEIGCTCFMCQPRNMSGWFQNLESTIRNQVLKPIESGVATGVMSAVTGVYCPISFEGDLRGTSTSPAAAPAATQKAPSASAQFVTDAAGNIYTLNANGQYVPYTSTTTTKTSTENEMLVKYMPYIEVAAVGILFALVLRR